MPDDAFDKARRKYADAMDEQIASYLNDAFVTSAAPPPWSRPQHDPLTDLYNAMQAVDPDKLILRSPNREGVYVITTLQPRSSDGQQA